MSVLSDSAILQSIQAGDIVIDPFNPDHVNPNSVDLTLHDTVKQYDPDLRELDVMKHNPVLEYKIPEGGLLLYPGELYLMSTNERAGTRCYHSQLKGKSSLARLGLFIDCTASWGDTGFVNHWTLEVSVVKPLRIYPNMKICQIIFSTVHGEVLNPYDKKPDSKYNGDNRAKESMYHLNFK